MAQESPSRKRSNPPQPKKNVLGRRGIQLVVILLVIVVVASALWVYYPRTSSTNQSVNQSTNTSTNNTTSASNPIAVINTSMGTIRVELFPAQMPITTANFIRLADAGFYTGLVFHRVINNFMIQSGGFYANGTQKTDPYGPIKLETSKNVTHVDGAISMARLNDPVDSATSQFFICDGSQHSLDNQYAAFGVVISGMDVVRQIAALDPAHTTTKYGSYANWPVDDVFINSITIETT